MRRILHPSDIPLTLFNPESGTLTFPSCLADAYRSALESMGALEQAVEAIHEGETGGAGAEEAARHFMTAFSGSCARLKLALLDPKEHLDEASNIFLRAFAGGRVGLLDVPCGAGAASAALLATIAELRRCEIIPAQPLEVFFLGGDISQDAMDYAALVMTALEPVLREQGVFITSVYRQWDLMDEISTTELLHAWMQHATGCRDHFVLTANFSGFLHNAGRLKAVQGRLEELFRWAAVRRSTVAWIEPQTKIAMKEMWPKLIAGLFNKIWRHFRRPSDPVTIAEPLCTEAQFVHPLRIGSRHKVRLSLVKLVKHTE